MDPLSPTPAVQAPSASRYLAVVPNRPLPSIGRDAGNATVAAAFLSLVAAYVLLPHWTSISSLFAGDAIRSWLVVALIIFAAAAVSSTVGFAFSAIAAAMVFHAVPDNIRAVQIMMVASIGIQAFSVAALRKTIRWSRCVPFLLGGAASLPAGIYLLLTLEFQAYIVLMGSAIAAYGAYMLFRRPPTVSRGGILADVAAGAAGGLTGPLAAFPGALVTIWCGLRGWDKSTQRAIYQPYILVMQTITLAGLCAATERATLDFSTLSYALPAIAGASLGLNVFQRLSDLQFQKLVNLALIISGLALLLK